MGWRDDPEVAPVQRPDPVARPSLIPQPQPRTLQRQVPPARQMPTAQPVAPESAPAAAEPTPQADAGRFAQPAIAASWQNDPEAPGLSWSDVPRQALQNAPGSAMKFAEGIVHPILHPIETVKAFRDIGMGLASKIYGAAGGTQDPSAKAKTEAAADAVGKHFADRYGTVEGFKQALATDPVGVIGDASVILTGGGAAAARGPGIVAKVGEAARAVGGAVDPLANIGRAATVGGKAAAEVLGVTTGAGARPIREAYQAGRTGNEVFAENMRGARPIDQVVDMADSAVGQMGKERSAAYQAGMKETNASDRTVDPRPIYKKINEGLRMAMYKDVPRSEAALSTAREIDGVVKQFYEQAKLDRKPNGTASFTPEWADALKQAVGEIRQKTQQGTLERKIADNVYRTIKDEIVTQVPSYAKAMKDYASASDNITEMRRTLSINDRASTDTTLRKLQSTMRNNVNANFGQREKLLDQLAKHEPDLPAALAGQTLNAWAPRGLMRGAAGGTALYGAATNPASMLALPAASPRMMGEASYAAGQGVTAAQKALAAALLDPAMVAAAARSGYAMNALTNQDQ